MSKTTLYLFQNISLENLDLNLLNEDERNYSNTLKNKRKEEYIAGRLLCKNILSKELNCSPKNIHIEKTKNGKPYIKKHPIHFNISHSNKKILIGLSYFEIGVDIQIMTDHPYKKTWEKLFPEKRIPSKEEFFITWTRYEALAKALDQSIFNTNKHPLVTHIHEISEYNKIKSTPQLSLFTNKIQNYMFSAVICGYITTIKTKITP